MKLKAKIYGDSSGFVALTADWMINTSRVLHVGREVSDVL
jgi:hypothetical protein